MIFLLLACAPEPVVADPTVIPKETTTEEGAPALVLPALAAERYTLGARLVNGALAVWPVLDQRPTTTGAYLTLADGLASGQVSVEEKDGGTVPELLVKNSADTPVLLAAGDIVTGGRQDRVIIADQVVPAGASVSVAVNCVEQGRWAGGASFGYGGRAEYALKQAVEHDNDQSRTWAKVAELNAKKADLLQAKGITEAALSPSTGTYRASLDADAVRAEAKPYADAVSLALTGDRVVGLVVAFDGQVIGAELFGSPALLARNKEAIAAGVARDAVSRGQGTNAPPPADGAARGFLDEALAAPAAAEASTGGAVRAKTESQSTIGKDLREADGDLVHRSTFKK